MGTTWLTGGLRQVWRILGMYVATILIHGLTFALWNRRGDVQLVLLTGPMLVSVLMLSPYRHWPAYGIGWVLGMMTFVFIRSYPTLSMVMVFAGCTLLMYATAYVLGKYRSDHPIEDIPRLLFFLLVAALLLPLAIAWMAVGATTLLPTPPWLHKVWWHMALAMSLGFVLLTPAVLSLANPASSLRRNRPPLRKVVTITVLSLALLWLGWREFGSMETTMPLLLITPVPLLIYVALRAQMPGVSIVNMLLGIMAISLSYTSHGPFIQPDPRATTLSVQLWMAGMSVASLCFAALVEQRRAVQGALSASHDEVRLLAGRLIVAQEQERERIARDLHDDINQRLAVASMRLSALRQKIADHHRSEISQLQSELIALSGDIRQLSHGLHPSMLMQIGLAAALEDLCLAHRYRHGPAIELRIPSPPDGLPDDVALCLYRVAQEAMGNAVKHAQARRIEIVLQVDATRVDLDVRDDGQGFDMQARDRRGLGLQSISERVKLLGGSYRLHSAPGKGTELGVSIPLTTPT